MQRKFDVFRFPSPRSASHAQRMRCDPLPGVLQPLEFRLRGKKCGLKLSFKVFGFKGAGV
jgi:hypothetical protein